MKSQAGIPMYFERSDNIFQVYIVILFQLGY